MKKSITLGNYVFNFNTAIEENVKYIEFTYLVNDVTVKIFRESFESALKYKPEFNSDYAVSELPEDVWDYLYNNKMLNTLKGWVATQYLTITIMETNS